MQSQVGEMACQAWLGLHLVDVLAGMAKLSTNDETTFQQAGCHSLPAWQPHLFLGGKQ